MFSMRRGSQICVLAPAKLNLFLELHGRRSDGYHEMETLMVPINLYDSISVTPSDINSTIQFACAWVPGLDPAACETMPDPTKNIAYRAIALLREQAGVSKGAKVVLRKRIPSQAGLGGGSSDAAAALIAANIAWGLNWSTAQLAEVASKIGSDVPFFLYQSLARCTGRGEIIHPVAQRGRLNFVIVKPNFGLSTPDVFQQASIPASPRGSESLLGFLAAADPIASAKLLFNRLESAARKLTPWIQEIASRMDQLAVCGHQMSGSGTSYFALCRNHRHARQVAAVLRATHTGRTIVATTIGPHAAR